MEEILKKKKQKNKNKKLKKKEFAEKFLNKNYADEPDAEARPDKDPKRAFEKPNVIASLKHDQNIQSKDKNGTEKSGTSEAAFFGDSFIKENKLTGEEFDTPSDGEDDGTFLNVKQSSESTLANLRKNQFEKIRKIHTTADSEDMMHQAEDFERLDGNSKQLRVLENYLGKVEKAAGNVSIDEEYKATDLARQINEDILKINHEDTAIKQRYSDIYPEGDKEIKSKLKAKRDAIYGEYLKERNGISIDKEPYDGFW